MGCACAIVFTSFGAAYGMGKSGIGVMAAGVLRPGDVMRSEFILQADFYSISLEKVHTGVLADLIDMMPPIMGGIIAIYGLVVAVLISNSLKEKLALFTGFLQLGAGLAVGLSGLAAGYADIQNRIWVRKY